MNKNYVLVLVCCVAVVITMTFYFQKSGDNSRSDIDTAEQEAKPSPNSEKTKAGAANAKQSVAELDAFPEELPSEELEALDANENLALDASDSQTQDDDASPEPKENEAPDFEVADGASQNNIPDHVDLWDLEDYQATDIDSIPAIATTIPVSKIANFKVGQALSFTLPGSHGSLTSTLVNANNPIQGVSVWEGEMSVAGTPGYVIVSKGEVETQFTFTLPETVYTASVDNKTGRTVIVDQAEYNKRVAPVDDTAHIDPKDLLPPP